MGTSQTHYLRTRRYTASFCNNSATVHLHHCFFRAIPTSALTHCPTDRSPVCLLATHDGHCTHARSTRRHLSRSRHLQGREAFPSGVCSLAMCSNFEIPRELLWT